MSKSDDQRDKELDQILGPFRKPKADTNQIRGWSIAVQARAGRKQWLRRHFATIAQIATAAAIGFVIGAWSFGHKSATENVATENIEPSATIEQVFAKAE